MRKSFWGETHKFTSRLLFYIKFDSLYLKINILLKTLTYTSIKELNPDRCTFSPKIQFNQSVFY